MGINFEIMFHVCINVWSFCASYSYYIDIGVYMQDLL